MQKDVIGEILQVEDNASAIIENADKESRRIVQEAQGEAAAMIRKAAEDARNEGNALVDEAEKVYEAHLAEYEDQQSALQVKKVVIDPALLKSAADRIVSTICRTELFGE